MHTIWKGSISFGLVNIPIKLHAATEDKDIKLRSLHKKCHTPIKYEKKCPVCEEEITADEIVKGYEIASGKFVILEDAELEQLKKATEEKAVEIIDFMKMEEIDPIYYNRSYYMSPNEGGMKAYGLLRKALVESNKVGLAKIVMRSKEQLAIIRVYQNTLLMETIHFPDEVRNVEEVPNVPAEDQTSEKELDTAILLIDQLTTTFQPEKYTDDYRSKLMEIIDSKRTGQEMVTVAEKKPTNVTDLMAALQASIDRTKPVEEKKTTRKRKATTKTKKAQ
ncbi:Ku protein [Bacillus ginsengihumi]|uniref:Non-homologous end joining protein Ku n=2 Tax=Heyndrickxia ginsengihumi TaxID=363870 RepID=A0A0A6VFT1_9BACI|nr:Ku protein [Heyndrickxia ginsengihumi]KHD85484.1 DNA repair protein [Heyndrickxia ginsengihumi]MBE6183171.1 Ku protein [Bacillus sp. (in: firmicutes)]MCM3023843.1 Ku protein [Heyndrickxia ginsengihumi]NEY20736.1 Ku protein [Heyndrickxia ginsengihumi]